MSAALDRPRAQPPVATRRRPDGTMRRGSAGRIAEGLGWFSLGLGALELVAARPLARGMGMRGQEALIRAYGLREIATGLAILSARDRAPWIRARVAGDALDIATLLANAPRNHRPGGLALAIGAVLGVTVLDLVCAEALRSEEVDAAKQARAVRAYASRSGFPMGAAASRGKARDLEVPRDFRIPEPLRPWA
jgi:hypothetical protein